MGEHSDEGQQSFTGTILTRIVPAGSHSQSTPPATSICPNASVVEPTGIHAYVCNSRHSSSIGQRFIKLLLSLHFPLWYGHAHVAVASRLACQCLIGPPQAFAHLSLLDACCSSLRMPVTKRRVCCGSTLCYSVSSKGSTVDYKGNRDSR